MVMVKEQAQAILQALKGKEEEEEVKVHPSEEGDKQEEEEAEVEVLPPSMRVLLHPPRQTLLENPFLT